MKRLERNQYWHCVVCGETTESKETEARRKGWTKTKSGFHVCPYCNNSNKVS